MKSPSTERKASPHNACPSRKYRSNLEPTKKINKHHVVRGRHPGSRLQTSAVVFYATVSNPLSGNKYLFLFSASPERVILKPSWLDLGFFPRVDNRQSRVLKIKLISGDKTITPLKSNRGDERVNCCNGSSFIFQPPGECPPDQHHLYRDFKNSSLKSEQQVRLKPFPDFILPFRIRKFLDTFSYLANRNNIQVDRVRIKPVEPFHHFLAGLLSNEFRDTVGVKQVVHRAPSVLGPLLFRLRSRFDFANGDSRKNSESFFWFNSALRY